MLNKFFVLFCCLLQVHAPGDDKRAPIDIASYCQMPMSLQKSDNITACAKIVTHEMNHCFPEKAGQFNDAFNAFIEFGTNRRVSHNKREEAVQKVLSYMHLAIGCFIEAFLKYFFKKSDKLNDEMSAQFDSEFLKQTYPCFSAFSDLLRKALDHSCVTTLNEEFGTVYHSLGKNFSWMLDDNKRLVPIMRIRESGGTYSVTIICYGYWNDGKIKEILFKNEIMVINHAIFFSRIGDKYIIKLLSGYAGNFLAYEPIAVNVGMLGLKSWVRAGFFSSDKIGHAILLPDSEIARLIVDALFLEKLLKREHKFMDTLLQYYFSLCSISNVVDVRATVEALIAEKIKASLRQLISKRGESFAVLKENLKLQYADLFRAVIDGFIELSERVDIDEFLGQKDRHSRLNQNCYAESLLLFLSCYALKLPDEMPCLTSLGNILPLASIFPNKTLFLPKGKFLSPLEEQESLL